MGLSPLNFSMLIGLSIRDKDIIMYGSEHERFVNAMRYFLRIDLLPHDPLRLNESKNFAIW